MQISGVNALEDNFLCYGLFIVDYILRFILVINVGTLNMLEVFFFVVNRN